MIELLFKITVISLSGALAPGPLTTATATLGLKKGWKSGLLTSTGHMIIELPYVILVAIGIIATFKHPQVNLFFRVFGSIFLFYFGLLTIKEAIKSNPEKERQTQEKINQPLLTGILLTFFNPYFFAWWVGIGAPLISEAMAKGGFWGLGLLYLFHIWLDYAWLIFIARIASFARLRTKLYRFILFLLGGVIIWFGLKGLLQLRY
ncbi:MAG: LysE family transporter [candidate division WOR-3 bacterium]